MGRLRDFEGPTHSTEGATYLTGEERLLPTDWLAHRAARAKSIEAPQ